MKKSFVVVALFAIIALISAACAETPGSTGTNPTVALGKYNDDLQAKRSEIKSYEQYMEVQKELALANLEGIKYAGLNSEEEFAYATLLSSAAKKDEATAIYEKLAKGNDIPGRKSNQKMMAALVEAEDWATLETSITDYRKRFPVAIPEETSHLFNPVLNLAYHYVDEDGNNEKALELVRTELAAINIEEAPYASADLLGYFGDAFDATGNREEFLAILNDYSAKTKAAIERRNAEAPAAPEAPEADAEVSEADAKAVEAYEEYAAVTKSYQRIAGSLNKTLLQANLIGQPSPTFELSNFFNVESLDIADLKGKVVVIDFWANWCGPCKDAFPSLKKLYEENKDKGLVVVGLTSFQKSFRDGDINEKNISEERELELTEDFIAKYEMTWPIAFSSRGAYDPEFGIIGIPTFAVLDKEGNVAIVKTGAGEANEKALRDVVAKLLAE